MPSISWRVRRESSHPSHIDSLGICLRLRLAAMRLWRTARARQGQGQGPSVANLIDEA